MVMSPREEGASCCHVTTASSLRPAQAVLGEFEQRAEQLAAQLADASAAQQILPDQLAADTGGHSQGSAAGANNVLSAAGSRRASKELSRHVPAAMAAEATQAGDITELQKDTEPHMEAIDGESRAAPDAGGDRSIADDDASRCPQGSGPPEACLDGAAADRADDRPRETASQGRVIEHQQDDSADGHSHEHGNDAAEAAVCGASGPVAAEVEERTPPSAASPASHTDATPNDSQYEETANLVPLPWIGPPQGAERPPLPAVQDSGLPSDSTLAADAAACHDDACMPVPMVSACSSPPALRPVKRARWSELQTMQHTVENGTADGVDCNDVGCPEELAGADSRRSDHATGSHHVEAQRDDTPVQQLCFERPSEQQAEQQLVAPLSVGVAATDIVLPTVETLTERLEGLSSLVMGQDGGSQVGSQGSPSAVGTALQGAARYVPWGECTPP